MTKTLNENWGICGR